MVSPPPKRDMKVLSLGLPRTGSTSMAEALTILGYKDVHHTSKYINRLNDWVLLSAAADATFPCLPTYTGKPWTREDWDQLYGSHEACTDAASMFGPELIAAYPDAKVILVHRDFDKWHKSVFGSLVPTVWGPMSNFSLKYIEPLVGFHGGTATRKVILGLFDSRTPEEAEQRSREAYDRHARRIREAVPKEMLLEYRMGQGWGPLCEFLGKDVPDQDFPWLNEAAMLGKIAMDITITNATKALVIMLPWMVAAGAVAAGTWYWLR
ncbi:P-loop containing nucleoside triphosphate hydrolase protein [Emericellopsis atlantica]|uniref:P-loop containing nucleoside triphosphate hydrolase protein n=1 Tax=Emericellopsis atlantica TaxID=2614577 RepID=A0A9P7ZNB0_9HYPO|nr:P-loop containing nucleoside triphosphate hydrolase protein [Emericellopsis atlantica]KAG9254842.1 P-loop containing nucleoside triphosphate hydrolase protein [Emericellopsis atlantica]